MFRSCPLAAAAVVAALPLGLAAHASAQTFCDYQPLQSVELDTDSTVINTSCGPRRVIGGVFFFRNVTIPPGVVVRGVGSRPMVWIVTGRFTVAGELRVDGEDGERVDTLMAPQFPAHGGAGGPAGGDGGDGSPNTSGRSSTGQSGFWPLQLPGLGGGGGMIACSATRGSGGGGGAFATQGDPFYKAKAEPGSTSFIQQLGVGGFGGFGSSGAPSRDIVGGLPGRRLFADSRLDNDFFGIGLDVHRRILIDGELPIPVGGAGGGGGGDRSLDCATAPWQSDAKGGGGGGGGGALVVAALGSIEIFGRVSANGGHGGGGEQAGSNNQGGGGGAGSGGMIVLYSHQDITLLARGETYANDDYDFVVSADGGVGLQGDFGGIRIDGKYPPPAEGALWDHNPTGAMGGLGLIQLFAPPGTNADGTNTILDDNIRVLSASGKLSGVEKTRFLGWRGYPDASGVWVDDGGNPTYSNPPSTPGYPAWAQSPDDEGDLRPAPILLPVL